MKTTKKILALLMVAMMLFMLNITAFADETTSYTITVTNENTAVSINGKTFFAYKVFDVSYNETNNAYVYSVPSYLSTYTYTVGGIEYSGDALINYVANLESDSTEIQAFAQNVALWMKNNGLTESTGVANGETATIEVDDPGYYAVVGDASNADGSLVHTAVSLTTAPNATVKVKVDIPTIDKTIVNADSAHNRDSIYGKGTAQDVGTHVQFRIVSKVPDMTGYTSYTFVINDTMSNGLTFDGESSVTVTIGGDTYTDFTVSTDAATNSFTLTFNNFVDQAANKGKDIVVTYTALINENAMEVNYDTNTATLTFSDNPNNTSSKSTTPESKVYVYNLNLVIDKYQKGSPDTKLAGAKFILYYKSSEDKYKYYKQDDDGNATWVQLESGQVDAAIANGTITVVTTDENGAANFDGLDARTYYLREVEAPAGYNLPTEVFTKAITPDYNLDGTINNSATTTSDQPIYTVYIENSTGSLLPSTGGIGTTIFYIVGSVLALGAAVLLITKKRMSVQNDF